MPSSTPAPQPGGRTPSRTELLIHRRGKGWEGRLRTLVTYILTSEIRSGYYTTRYPVELQDLVQRATSALINGEALGKYDPSHPLVPYLIPRIQTALGRYRPTRGDVDSWRGTLADEHVWFNRLTEDGERTVPADLDAEDVFDAMSIAAERAVRHLESHRGETGFSPSALRIYRVAVGPALTDLVDPGATHIDRSLAAAVLTNNEVLTAAIAELGRPIHYNTVCAHWGHSETKTSPTKDAFMTSIHDSLTALGMDADAVLSAYGHVLTVGAQVR